MATQPIKKQALRLAMITSQAFSLINFRGPLIQELVKRGAQVYAFAPDYDDTSRSAIQAIGAIPVEYSLSRVGMNPFRDGRDLIGLAGKLRRLNIDMTLAYFIKPVIYGTLAAWIAGVGKRFVMIEGAGYVFIENPLNFSLARRVLRFVAGQLYRLSLSRAERVFLLNKDDEKLFVQNKMVAQSKVCLIHGIGLDLAHFQPAPAVLNPPCFVLVARLLREKGIGEFVKAARIVKAKHPQSRFLILGDVDLNPGSISESEARAWVDEGIVEWPGQVADVRPWLAQASVFVLPSYREGLPRSTQEAMAMGRPVITTDVPGCRDTVESGVNGFVVPVRDPDALAGAMLRFVAEPDLIETMGEQSRRMAVERYDVHQINSIILTRMAL